MSSSSISSDNGHSDTVDSSLQASLDTKLDDDKMSDSVASSVDSTMQPQPTSKRGSSAPAIELSWFSWALDKYTTQYAIPPAYAPAALQICITAFPLGILFGLVLPRVISFFSSLTPSPMPHDTPWYCFPQLHLYLLSWVVFHMLEFTVTASYNPTRLFSDSFLLNNGVHYHLAHLFALVEFCLTTYLYPSSKHPSVFTWFGLILVVMGQGLRSGAMIHASNNFSHIVADKKRQDHQLVTTGVYGWTRHPSYVGFFYWATGTQVLLGNKVALVGFVGMLWVFFSRRIRGEEKYLIEFFGEEYRAYRRRVGTGLPFI